MERSQRELRTRRLKTGGTGIEAVNAAAPCEIVAPADRSSSYQLGWKQNIRSPLPQGILNLCQKSEWKY